MLEPARIIRAGVHSIEWHVYMLLSKTAPLPARMTSFDILRINLDRLLRRSVPDPSELIGVAKYMKSIGYEIEEPPVVRKSGIDVVDEERVVEWFHSVLRRREDEDILDYLDRVAHFIARMLVIYKFISALD